MWAAFLATLPEAEATAAAAASCSAWHFCDDQPSADELAEIVLSGRKRATASLLWVYELYDDEPLAKSGDFSVITDWEGRARCVIRTTSVEIVPFAAVTRELAADAPRTGLAWDCATGSGQAAVGLAERFARVIATDKSRAQIEELSGRLAALWGPADRQRAVTWPLTLRVGRA
jgi:uncharacterized protein YhfF